MRDYDEYAVCHDSLWLIICVSSAVLMYCSVGWRAHHVNRSRQTALRGRKKLALEPDAPIMRCARAAKKKRAIHRAIQTIF